MCNIISITKLYEIYLDTVGRCTPAIRSQSDEMIEYNLFEEFDIGACSFLHEDSLAKLLHAGLIDDEMMEISKEVRRRWLSLVDRARTWTIDEIKHNREFDELFNLCNSLQLKSMQRETSE